MIREIIKFGHPVLRAKGAEIGEIDDAVRALASDMEETMRDANGVGLAAQQVGEAVQLTVIDVLPAEDRPSWIRVGGKHVDLADWMPMVLLNPRLELGPEKVQGIEGCLSFPEMTADITRSEEVRVKGMLLDGSKVEFEAGGLLARALQHEVDHLNGVLFIDRMTSAAKAGLSGRLKRLKKEGEEQKRQGK